MRLMTASVAPLVLLTSCEVSLEFQINPRTLMLASVAPESVIVLGSVARYRLSKTIVFDEAGTPSLAQFTPEPVVHDIGVDVLPPSQRLMALVLYGSPAVMA